MATEVPPLPIEVRDRILSHLLPPSPPLPIELLSRSFLQRLTFLPPADSDLDAHLSPLPSSSSVSPHPLTDALQQLAGSLQIGTTEYAHDGEMTIAHTLLTPEFGGRDDGAVEINFQHEAGDKGRGWVYSGAKLGTSSFDWRTEVQEVVGYGSGASYGDGVDDYWAGFTPPSQHAELHSEHADEDDYWAQYGAGEPQNEDDDHVDEPVPPPSANITAPDPAAALTFLLHGMGSGDIKDPESKEEEERSASPSSDTKSKSSSRSSGSGSGSDGTLVEQKIRAKARAQLMRAWKDFSDSGTDAESAAYDWLRLGREVADRPSWGSSQQSHDARVAVVTARLEAAKDMHDVLDEEGGAYWRLVEETIRIHTSPVGDGEEQGWEQS